MTMVRFTYEDDAGNQIVATWTPEYGVTVAGHRLMRERLLVEVIQPEGPPPAQSLGRERAPSGSSLVVPQPGEDEGVLPPACTVCGHRRHGEESCLVRVAAAGGDACGCYGDHLELR